MSLRSATSKDGVRSLGHTLDLHTGHGAIMAPRWLGCPGPRKGRGPGTRIAGPA
jgi:hypothetical protein